MTKMLILSDSNAVLVLGLLVDIKTKDIIINTVLYMK